MSLFPGEPSPPAPPRMPKLTPQERRTRRAGQLKSIRLRMMIRQDLDNRGITSSAEISTAIGMAEPDAVKRLNRKQWREGDIALLEAAAMRLGLYPGKAGW